MIKADPRLYMPFGLTELPPEGHIILDGYESPSVRKKVLMWRKKFDDTWDWMKLARYLINNNRECQDLSDEELNQFRKDL